MNIEVNKKAAAYGQQVIIIDASSERIFNILSGIPGWPQWQSQVKTARFAGGSSENKHFIWQSGGIPIKSTFHTNVPNHELGWMGRIGWINMVQNWYLEEEGSRTKVTLRESFEGVGAGFLQRSLRKRILVSIRELKDFSEDNH